MPCVYTGTRSGYPLVSMVDERDERVVVALGGNGSAAKSSDELGRLAAALVAASTAGDDLGPRPDPAVFALG